MVYNDPHTLKAMSSVEWECIKMYEYHPNGTMARLTANDNDYLDLVIYLRRKADYYKINVILPVCVAVTIAWASFFIARGAVPARVGMTVVCYLTLSNTRAAILATVSLYTPPLPSLPTRPPHS